jgi:hypothetical protein
MSGRKILSLACPVSCMTCLVVAYVLVGQWMALLGVLFASLAWLCACQRPSSFLPQGALAVSVGLAVAGLLAGAPPWLMLLSATLALASWDVILLDHALADNPPATTATLFESRHYQSLVVALGLGLLAAIVGRDFRFPLPLGGVIFLVILALFSLERIWRTLRA